MVYKGQWRGVECAVKQLNVPVIDHKAREEFRKEASLMQYMTVPSGMLYCGHIVVLILLAGSWGIIRISSHSSAP